MIIEHLFYTGALALVVGLVLTLRGIPRERAYILIVMGASLFPDITWPLFEAAARGWATIAFMALVPDQVALHNLAGLVVFTLVATLLATPFHLRSRYVALCCALGYGSHLLEDGLTHTTRYFLVWPLSTQHVGIPLFVPYIPDLFGIAEARVLAVGLVLLGLAVAVRTAIQGRGWWRNLVRPGNSPPVGPAGSGRERP